MREPKLGGLLRPLRLAVVEEADEKLDQDEGKENQAEDLMRGAEVSRLRDISMCPSQIYTMNIFLPVGT